MKYSGIKGGQPLTNQKVVVWRQVWSICVKKNSLRTSSTIKVPMRPIMQALEFHISAVLVNPRKGGWNFGCAFGNSTWKWKSQLIKEL